MLHRTLKRKHTKGGIVARHVMLYYCYYIVVISLLCMHGMQPSKCAYMHVVWLSHAYTHHHHIHVCHALTPSAKAYATDDTQ